MSEADLDPAAKNMGVNDEMLWSAHDDAMILGDGIHPMSLDSSMTCCRCMLSSTMFL